MSANWPSVVTGIASAVASGLLLWWVAFRNQRKSEAKRNAEMAPRLELAAFGRQILPNQELHEVTYLLGSMAIGSLDKVVCFLDFGLTNPGRRSVHDVKLRVAFPRALASEIEALQPVRDAPSGESSVMSYRRDIDTSRLQEGLIIVTYSMGSVDPGIVIQLTEYLNLTRAFSHGWHASAAILGEEPLPSADLSREEPVRVFLSARDFPRQSAELAVTSVVGLNENDLERIGQRAMEPMLVIARDEKRPWHVCEVLLITPKLDRIPVTVVNKSGLDVRLFWHVKEGSTACLLSRIDVDGDS
jgi:hypothetical protein